MASPVGLDGVQEAWPLNATARSRVIERIADNLRSISFFNAEAKKLSASDAAKYAEEIENESYDMANNVVSAGEGISVSSAKIRAYAKHASQLMFQELQLGPPQAYEAHVEEATAAIEEQPDEQIPPLSFNVSEGKREMLTKDTAEELLAPLLAPGAAFAMVKLSEKSFGSDAAEVAARALANCRNTLTHADLSDIIAGRMEDVALKVLSEVCGALEGSRLTSLNLSDNALGEKGVRACASALKGQMGLRHLYFCNNGISVEAAAAIKELLPSATELRTLHFFNNMTGDGGADALAQVIAEARQLTDFRFSSTRVGPVGGVALSKALAGGSNLRKVDVRDNMFGEEGGGALAAALRQHPHLTELYLSDTGLGDEGLIAVADALKEGAGELEVLELGGNDITEASAPSLASCLAAMPSLRRLNLTENELQDKGAVIISTALTAGHVVLEELDLSMNELGRVGAVAAARAVCGKDHFKLLNLNGNHISEGGIEVIKKELRAGPGGQSVLGPLDENEEEEEEEEDDDEEGGEEGLGDSLSNLALN